jgi:hypothetical protein
MHCVLQPDNIFDFAANYFAEKQHSGGDGNGKQQRVGSANTIKASLKARDASGTAAALYGTPHEIFRALLKATPHCNLQPRLHST